MLTSHAKRIFSDNVTCFGKNKSCSNRSHLPQCFIKALRFLLAWLLCFYMENPTIFFWKAIFATSPIVPAVTIHTLPWKMRVETCLLSFQYGILPGSFPFRAWCGDFQFRGCISTQPGTQISRWFVRVSAWEEVVYIGQDMIKDLKVSKMSKKCQKVKRGEAPQIFVFFLSCTCRQENLRPTKSHFQIRRVG